LIVYIDTVADEKLVTYTNRGYRGIIALPIIAPSSRYAPFTSRLLMGKEPVHEKAKIRDV
jgi:hypothetical protein